MKIEYKTLDLKRESIKLENVIDVTINGIKIVETKLGLQLSVDNKIVIIPRASSMIEIESKEF